MNKNQRVANTIDKMSLTEKARRMVEETPIDSMAEAWEDWTEEELNAEAYIAVIHEGKNPVCVGEIR